MCGTYYKTEPITRSQGYGTGTVVMLKTVLKYMYEVDDNAKQQVKRNVKKRMI